MVTLIVAFSTIKGFVLRIPNWPSLEAFLNKEKGATIVHDPRVIWNTIDVVAKCKGNSVISKTGHAFVKATINSDAIYGGEISRTTILGILNVVIAV